VGGAGGGGGEGAVKGGPWMRVERGVPVPARGRSADDEGGGGVRGGGGRVISAAC